MTGINRTKNEYGGFLPLELNPGKEYFAEYAPYMHRFNSVKAALSFLIKHLSAEKIYIPYYYCPSTIAAIRDTGLEIAFYHINEELLPIGIADEQNSIVLLVDYFGVCSEKISCLAKAFNRAEVVIDRAHAFFEAPIVADHIHNVYSAKKFFGVPDGAYLISNAAIISAETMTDACEYSGYLLCAYEQGTNAAYTAKKETDGILAVKYSGMSRLALGLLQNVDYGKVKQRRINNYRLLRLAFEDRNSLYLSEKSIPYQFPFLIKKQGRGIKKKLIQEKIFVSTLWSGEDLKEHGNEFELSMMHDGIFLPIDQRYDEADMEFLISTVKDLIQ